MRWCCRLMVAGMMTWGAVVVAEELGSFFDPRVGVHGSVVAIQEETIPRGLLLRCGETRWVLYDQDLLRPVAFWDVAARDTPVTLAMMSQSSWEQATKKAGVMPPVVNGELWKMSDISWGVGVSDAELKEVVSTDRLSHEGMDFASRYLAGYEDRGGVGVLESVVSGIKIREWYQVHGEGVVRHLEVDPGGVLWFHVGVGEVAGKHEIRLARRGGVVKSNHPGLQATEGVSGGLMRLAASKSPRRVSLYYGPPISGSMGATPALPKRSGPRWSERFRAPIRSEAKRGPGWAMDVVELPAGYPLGRRVRPADVVFTGKDEAAVVTFEGDVWKVKWRDKETEWRRIAGGLSEPLSIEKVGGELQVFSRQGLIRLRDEDKDGEVDRYVVFSRGIVHSAGLRSYPLDMEVAEDGTTWCSIGGIDTAAGGIHSRRAKNRHSGSILQVDPEGKVTVLAEGAREPFFARDPEGGRLVMSDQQGNWVPSSGLFPVEEGFDFGYGGSDRRVPMPFVWIPHEEDTSSASPLWLRGSAFKEWEGAVLNLSYGTGKLFLGRPADKWPAVSGGVIPLEIETGIPLLHARINPQDGAIWMTGFRIYDSRVKALQGMGRLRRTDEKLEKPVDAQVYADGFVLRWDHELDPKAITDESVSVRSWGYRATEKYGSPRFKRDGEVGMDEVPTGTVLLSTDRRSVFVHVPRMSEAMQYELRYRWMKDEAVVYFSGAELEPLDWNLSAFKDQVLDDAADGKVRRAVEDMPASADWGRLLSAKYGCAGCHSHSGKNEGQSGPSWASLFGAQRTFTDGTRAKADEAYLRESILEPDKKIVQGFQVGMASYAGVLSEKELESIILFIKTLR